MRPLLRRHSTRAVARDSRCYDVGVSVRRRRYFIHSALGWVLCRLLPAHAVPLTGVAPAEPSAPAESTLGAYVDILIPADETPSGTALGVDRQLLLAAKASRENQRLLDLGLAWLNDQARASFGGDFPALDEGEQQTIVGQAATADYGTLPRVFFERTRADAFSHYYRRPESWRGIVGYRGPPQPLGFMDYYTRPPRASR
jgi:hypothetical protein